MLIIGDIHIQRTYADRILESIRAYISSHPDEREVVFVGDYVYHFNYDRKALLALYQLFVDLFEQGKRVHVLAGNHDWIAEHFVYEEGQKAFRYVSTYGKYSKSDEFSKSKSDGSAAVGELVFYTEPTRVQIAGQDVLMFPYMRPSSDVQIRDEFVELGASSHDKEIRSARANSLLWEELEKRREEPSEKMGKEGEGEGEKEGEEREEVKTTKSDKLLVIHHWYIAGTQFPGQFARFSYKSPALSAELLDMDDVMMISGHLHQPFCLKNYLCVGSVRYTSPLELNQLKYLRQVDINTGKKSGRVCKATPVLVNPYMSVDISDETQVDANVVTSRAVEIEVSQKECLSTESTGSTGGWDISCEPIGDLVLHDWTVTLRTTKSYQQIGELIDDTVFAQLKDVKIKQPSRTLPQMVELLDTESKELGTRISDWKTLLREYISQKYGEHQEKYVNVLEELEVM